MSIPHADHQITVNCAVITISDTRTENSDRSGQLIQTRLQEKGHVIKAYLILKDDPQAIIEQISNWAQLSDLDVIITNGGTGIAPRDTTYDALIEILEKTLPGFGELFRYLSYQEIGSSAIASRAVAGLYQNKLIFSLPGSSNAVGLGMEQLILPQLSHLVGQLRGD